MRVLIAGLCLLFPAMAMATVNEDVLRATQACMAEAKTYEQQHYCMLKSSPRKCRPLLRGKAQKTLSLPIRQKWLGCISTCEGASLYSRKLGECSTPSDPNK
jgi:hypothetical protein